MSSQSQSYTALTAAIASQEALSAVDLPASQHTGALDIYIEVDTPLEDDHQLHYHAPATDLLRPERREALASPLPIMPALEQSVPTPFMPRSPKDMPPPPLIPTDIPSSPKDMPPPPPAFPIPFRESQDVEVGAIAPIAPSIVPPLSAMRAPSTAVIDPRSSQETHVQLQGILVQEASSLLPEDEPMPAPQQPPMRTAMATQAPSFPPGRQPDLSPPMGALQTYAPEYAPEVRRSSTMLRRQPDFTPPKTSPPPTARPTSTSIGTHIPEVRRSSTGLNRQPDFTPPKTSPPPTARPTSTSMATQGSDLRGTSTGIGSRSFAHQAPPIAHANLPVLATLPSRQGEQAATQQAHLPMYIAPSREELKKVKQIVHLIHRAYQAFEFYPFNHPIVQQFSQQLLQNLQDFFQYREMLELRLDRFQVLYCGQMIFQEEALTNNFAYLLFSDGIRKLIIDSGLTEDEYMRFFMVLHRSSRRRSVTEDTTTLLWEQQFVFIRYFLVEDLTEMYLPDLQALYDNLEQQAQQNHGLGAVHGSPQAVQLMAGLARARLAPSQAEEQTLQQAVQEEERGLMQRFLEVISRVLEHGEEGLQLDRLVRVLSQLQPILLSVGEIDHLALCLYYTSRLSQLFARRNSAQAQEWHQMLQNILRESHSEHVIQKLIAYIDQNPHNETMQQQVFQYVQWLSPPSPDNLLKAFSWANSFATRQLWCRSLAAKYKDDPRQLTNGILSPEPIVVRNTCVILGEIGHSAARPLLQRAAKHDDPDVRAEATRALLQFGGAQTAQPQLLQLIKKNLYDSNPDVRRSALQGIPQLGQRGVSLLRGLYKDRTYDQWSPEEQRQLFDTTVRMGQRFPESIDLMVQAVLKQYSGWLAGRRDPTQARAVVQSLQSNSSPRAIAAIEKLYQEGSEAIRNACEFVTQRL